MNLNQTVENIQIKSYKKYIKALSLSSEFISLRVHFGQTLSLFNRKYRDYSQCAEVDSKNLA